MKRYIYLTVDLPQCLRGLCASSLRALRVLKGGFFLKHEGHKGFHKVHEGRSKQKFPLCR